MDRRLILGRYIYLSVVDVRHHCVTLVCTTMFETYYPIGSYNSVDKIDQLINFTAA